MHPPIFPSLTETPLYYKHPPPPPPPQYSPPSYFPPFLHPVLIDPSRRHAADAIAGGKWLGIWVTIIAAVANSGSFLSEMSVTSQTLIGMSERGLLPKRLMDESRHGTYPWALGVIAALVAVSQPLDFTALVLICEYFLCPDMMVARSTDGSVQQ